MKMSVTFNFEVDRDRYPCLTESQIREAVKLEVSRQAKAGLELAQKALDDVNLEISERKERLH